MKKSDLKMYQCWNGFVPLYIWAFRTFDYQPIPEKLFKRKAHKRDTVSLPSYKQTLLTLMSLMQACRLFLLYICIKFIQSTQKKRDTKESWVKEIRTCDIYMAWHDWNVFDKLWKKYNKKYIGDNRLCVFLRDVEEKFSCVILLLYFFLILSLLFNNCTWCRLERFT